MKRVGVVDIDFSSTERYKVSYVNCPPGQYSNKDNATDKQLNKA